MSENETGNSGRKAQEKSGVGESVRGWIYRLVGGLVMEQKSGNDKPVVSIGRVLILVTMAFMVSFWITWLGQRLALQTAIETTPPGLIEVFLTLGGYVFGGKALQTAKDIFAKKETPRA